MYNFTEYSNNFLKMSRDLYLFYRDKLDLENNGVIAFFADNNTTDSFKFKKNNVSNK